MHGISPASPQQPGAVSHATTCRRSDDILADRSFAMRFRNLLPVSFIAVSGLAIAALLTPESRSFAQGPLLTQADSPPAAPTPEDAVAAPQGAEVETRGP